VQDITDNGHFQPLETVKSPAQSQKVKECLGRVFSKPIPGVNDMKGSKLGEVLGRPTLGVTDNEHIGLEPSQSPDGIPETFSLPETAHFEIHVGDLHSQEFPGNFKRSPGTGAGLKEEVNKEIPP
jgi:hypothetical protein